MARRKVTLHLIAQAEFDGAENSSQALAQALITLAASSAVLHGKKEEMAKWKTVEVGRNHGDEPLKVVVSAAATVEYL